MFKGFVQWEEFSGWHNTCSNRLWQDIQFLIFSPEHFRQRGVGIQCSITTY